MHEIRVADCHAEIPKLADKSIRTVIADVPYNIGYDYGGEYSDDMSDADYIAVMGDWMEAILPKLTDDGSLWLVISDEYAAELTVEAKRRGYVQRDWCIWYYTFGVATQTKFSRSHTHLIRFGTGRATAAFFADAVRVESARSAQYKDKRANPKGKVPDNTWILFPKDLPSYPTDVPGLDEPDDVIIASRVAGTFKQRVPGAPNQLPETLVARMILSTSEPGDLVVDPFVGTGTTVAVAKKLNRNAIGIEQSSVFAATASQRVAGVQPGDPLA